MARGRRATLEAIGQELNLIPYMDVMVNLVIFMLATITGFLSFTVLNATIPQLAPDAQKAVAQQMKKASMLLMVRVTPRGYRVDPNVQGGKSIPRIRVPKKGGSLNYKALNTVAEGLKSKFPTESRVLIIAWPDLIYDEIIQTMDALRERESGMEDLFPDVTLSILR